MSASADEQRENTRSRARSAEQSAPAGFSLPVRALSYAGAIFLGSTLLFLLEPIAAKRILPLLGGSAAVWTACLVFFQIALLVGYLAAHALVTRLLIRAQIGAYAGMLVLSLVQLLWAANPTLVARADRP